MDPNLLAMETVQSKKVGVHHATKNLNGRNAKIEDLNSEIKRLQDLHSKEIEEEHRKKSDKLQKEKADDLDNLAALKSELKELDDAAQLSGKLSLDDARNLGKQRTALHTSIAEIETKYGLYTDAQAMITEKQVTVWPTVAKIVALLAFCWGIVIYSGDWILDKYPNAAIYNDVSFQKVLFGFSVFIAGIASVIMSLAVFFPGLGKYFNPFNRYELDFFNDFQKLTPWQRNIIAIVLFSCLLLGFVLTVSGKLD